MSPEPLVKDGISEGVQQDKDGVVWRQVGGSARAVQEQMCQVVQTSHHWVVGPGRGAVT